MTLGIGTQLGPYEILAPLGAGGMGEVYRAHDTKLNRDVALKVLPAAFANDAERMARLQREAQVLASLNHPNIASIYGLEESGKVRALIMELVEGPTLADRIETGPIRLEESLAIAKQIAEALEYAHEKGIMHRDLKPANVKVTAEGMVKVLDFGLARVAEQTATSTNPASSPTLTLAATQAGVILGTAAYMAPEQARGQAADKRADIWAFGVVLYEMLAGKRMFGGETVSDTLAAVLTRDPEWDRLPAGTPAGSRRLLRRCMERDKRKRLQSIGDGRIEIEEYLADPAGASALTDGTVTSQPVRSHLFPWVVAAFLGVIAVIALGFALLHFREAPVGAPVMKSSIPLPEKASLGSFAISPDGRWLAFTAATGGNDQLWVRGLDTLKAQVMAGTEGAGLPFWSPDSRSIGFFASGKLKKVEASGGPVQTVCDVSGASSGGTWNRDGVIVFATIFGLNRVSATGGSATLIVTRSSQEYPYSPSFLPDSRHFLYSIRSAPKETRGIYFGSLDATVKQRLLGDNSNAVYAPSLSTDKRTGYLLFLREGALLAQPFDAQQLKLAGEPFALAEQVGKVFMRGSFSISDDGVLVYDSSLNRQSQQLIWVDRQGKLIRSLGVGGYGQPWLSADEKRVVVDRWDNQTDNANLWLYDVMRGAPSHFTFDPAGDFNPVWSPDGSRIIWRSNREGTVGLYSKAASGAGADELLHKSSNPETPTGWSLDGRFLIYYELDPKTKRDLWVLPLFGDKKPFPFLQTEWSEAAGQLSPDGRWMAYASDQTGAFEIYVRSFPSGGGQWQVSTKGGTGPCWRRNGKELFYYAPDGKLMAAEVKSGASFETGVPHVLFEFRSGSFIPYIPYSVTADGQRFLLNTVVDESGGAPLTVVVNWTKEWSH